MLSITGVNPELLKVADWVLDGQPATALPGLLGDFREKSALVPAGGGAPPDPSAGGGMPPGGAPAPAPAPPGGDPAAAGMAGPPQGPIPPEMLTQLMQAFQQMNGGAAGGGGAGGKGGGKKAEQQILSSQLRILTHLVVQIAQKMDIQVDPALLVGPPGDPAVESQAMQEMTQTPAVPTVGGGADPSMMGGGGGGGGMPPAAPPPDMGAGGGGGMPKMGHAIESVGQGYSGVEQAYTRATALAALMVQLNTKPH